MVLLLRVYRITTEIEAYQQKLQEYEQALNQAIQYEYPLKEEIREELKRYQHVLELGEEDVARTEEKLVRQREANQYHLNLSQSPNQDTLIIPTHKTVKRITMRLQLVIIITTFLGSLLVGYYLPYECFSGWKLPYSPSITLPPKPTDSGASEPTETAKPVQNK